MRHFSLSDRSIPARRMGVALVAATLLTGVSGLAFAEPLSLADARPNTAMFDQNIHDQPTTEPPSVSLQMPEHLRRQTVDYNGR